MSYKITNPTNKKLRIQYKGTIYECPANGERENTPEDAAFYWKNQIHNFIGVTKEAEVSVDKVVEEVIEEATKEEVVEKTPEVVEEVIEEVVEPKKSNKKSKNK